jgi:hypothetical protein
MAWFGPVWLTKGIPNPSSRYLVYGAVLFGDGPFSFLRSPLDILVGNAILNCGTENL